MELGVIGVGYVGLVTGACFAEMGYHVHCLDIDKMKIQFLQQGHIPIYEPGLEEVVKRNQNAKRLFFTTDYKDVVNRSDILFLALPTPSLSDGSCDVKSIYKSAEQIASLMESSKIIIVKSTVPVGTSDGVQEAMKKVLLSRNVPFEVEVVSNPEFLKEGCAIQDFMKPDRVIIGCSGSEIMQKMRDLYRPFMFSHERLIFMDRRSAELSKYAANTMLATRISFMNWLSELAEKTGADILSIRKGLGSDKRIGYDFLWPGVGYGGSCLPKDTRALRSSCLDNGVETDFIDAIINVNERQKRVLPDKIAQYYKEKGGVKGKTFALLGLSFKPETDDMREAASLIIIEELVSMGALLRVYDPVAMESAKRYIVDSSSITFCSDEMHATQGADAIVLITEWKQFRLLSMDKVLQEMTGNAFFDGRNQYNPQDMLALGFDYISIGRQAIYSLPHTEPSELTIPL